MDLTDDQLLADYVARRSQEAFAELVRRQVDLVYGAAQRQVRDPHLADDVTQSVFIVLSRRAKAITPGTFVGWLLKTTRYAAFNANKMQSRRRMHEKQAAAGRNLTKKFRRMVQCGAVKGNGSRRQSLLARPSTERC